MRRPKSKIDRQAKRFRASDYLFWETTSRAVEWGLLAAVIGHMVVTLLPLHEGPSKHALFFLALLAKPTEQQALLGDATERYNLNSARLGPMRAKLLLWSEVMRSATALGLRLLRFTAIGGMIRALFERLFN